MKNLKDYQKKTYLGVHDGEKIYLSAPSWDCGWYWGFGYLGNKDCHYHVDGLKKGKDLHTALIEHFGSSLIIRPSHLWTFAELFTTFYALKETAEVLGRGGSHLTTNPCKDIITNTDEVKRINEVVLPAIFDAIYNILEKNKDNGELFNELVKLNIKGDTAKVVAFMLEYGVHTDDLKSIDKLTADDVSNIHTHYWREFHANKKVKA